jgi:hypothetical protein
MTRRRPLSRDSTMPPLAWYRTLCSLTSPRSRLFRVFALASGNIANRPQHDDGRNRKLVGRSPCLYAPRTLEASSLAPYSTAAPCPQAAVAMEGTDKPRALTTKWLAVQVMGTRCSIDFHSGAFRPRHRKIKPPRRIRCGMDAPVRSYQNARERRIPIEHAQHLVAAAIRHFEQHTVNTGFPVGREYRLVCRCVEHRD